MPLLENDSTTTLSKGTLDGDAMDESKHFQSDGQTVAKSPRVCLVDDNGVAYDDSNPLPIHLHASDRQLLGDIKELLQQLVRLGGGIA